MPTGDIKNLFFEGSILTGKCTELANAITGGATILRMAYKTMLRVERAENFMVYNPTCYSPGVQQMQIKSKHLTNKFVLRARRQFGGSCPL